MRDMRSPLTPAKFQAFKNGKVAPDPGIYIAARTIGGFAENQKGER
jgi:hypothetical protein